MPINKHSLLAQGRMAEIHSWGEGRVLKLFRGPWFEAAQREARIAQLAHASGVRTPAVFEVGEWEGRPGIVFERVPGISLLAMLPRAPWRLWAMGRALAELHFSIHRVAAPAGLTTVHARLREGLANAQHLPESLRASVAHRLAQLPEGAQLCHGDFHPDNVLFTATGPVIVDWPGALSGYPLADVMMTSILLRIGALPPHTPTFLRVTVQVVRAQFHGAYLRRYLQLARVAPTEIYHWQAPLAAARLSENIEGEREPLMKLIKEGIASAQQ